MKKTLKFAIMAVAALAAVACNGSSDSDELSSQEEALKAAVTEYVPNVIYEIYGNLADNTAALYESLAYLKEKGVNSLTQTDIDKVCTKFLNARTWWEQSEAFLFGAATAYGIDPHIDSWPLDKDKLAKELSNATVIADLEAEGAGAVDEVGVANLGFHGIEFILFRDGANRTVSALKGNETDEAFASYSVSGADELIFATAVAEDLRNYCWELQCAWDPNAPSDRVEYVEDELELNTTLDSGLTYGENLLASGTAGSTFSSWQRAVSTILVGGCSNICSEVANSKIASAYTGDDTDYIESPYSKKSYEDFANNIRSIVFSLYGSEGASEPSSKCIYSVLKKYNYSGLSDLQSSLDAALNSLIKCITSGVAFVDDPDAACAGAAIDAINALDDELNKAADFVETL